MGIQPHLLHAHARSLPPYPVTLVNYSAAMDGVGADQRFVPVTPWWQVVLVTLESIAIAGTVIGGAYWVFAFIRGKRKQREN